MRALKTRLKSTWESGDYRVFVKYLERGALEFFAPRPELVASEMVRVCTPGGKIIMGNWTPEGHAGQMFWTTNNGATGGSTHVLSEYPEVIGTRA
jgi:hypothetical protein